MNEIIFLVLWGVIWAIGEMWLMFNAKELFKKKEEFSFGTFLACNFVLIIFGGLFAILIESWIRGLVYLFSSEYVLIIGGISVVVLTLKYAIYKIIKLQYD